MRIYSGESVGKKVARLELWNRVRVWFGDNFVEAKHLVLCSKEGGDISVLCALGVPEANIIAVDSDIRALERCNERFPGVVYFHGDVREALKQQRGRIDTAFLDFCGWATDEQCRAVADAAASVRPGGIVAHGFMRGREQKTATRKIRTERQKSIERRQRETEKILRAIGRAPRASFVEREADGRHGWVLDRLLNMTNKHNSVPHLFCALRYHSTCSWRRGVPMMIVARWIERLPKIYYGRELDKQRKKAGRFWVEALERMEQNAWGLSATHGVDVTESNSFTVTYSVKGLPVAPGVTLDKEWIAPVGKSFEGRELASMLALVDAAGVADDLRPGRAHDLLNIRKQRLAAIRAHASRGTYGRSPDP